MRSTTNHNCIAQLSLAGLAWVAALLLLPISASAGVHVQGRPLDVPGTGITVYGPAYVLDHFTHREGSRLVFTDRQGYPWTLVEDPSSQVISNRGDGSFHPFDVEEVAATIEAISYPIDKLEIEIFVLPFPRAELLDCSTGEGTIYLSPGVYEVKQSHAHMIVTHEIGHCVHRALMPDGDRRTWVRYKEMRGISDLSVYSASASHCNRPHEIFAEDFRWLFGGWSSRYSGTIENRSLVLPDDVFGLRDFMFSLAEIRLERSEGPGATAELEIANYPNPFSETTTVNLQVGQAFSAVGYTLGDKSAHALVFDARGRAVKDLGRRNLKGNAYLQFRWDGTDSSGRKLPSGVYFLQVRLAGGEVSSVHKMLLKR